MAPESTPLVPLPSRPGTARSPARATLRRARIIAEAVFARGGVPPASERLEWLEAELEDFLARAGMRSRTMLGVSFWVVAFLAPLCGRRVARLETLPVPARVEALTALERTLPEPLLAVKALLCLIYYEHPDAAAEVGVRAPHLVALRAAPSRGAGGRA